ncbi:AzlD domain-containing protein [Glycomyces albidus]|uniref:AzlD domain-containing protein n=1 Tax=Glycomyces albidus TaxID=2656774 RepID=A0A6L5G3R7_9ACTN|nr:AzlD domain-containing protein [Glycomyces albidus]MQM24341.1 AzlD domain-containing protein [Glycomyces albidus]
MSWLEVAALAVGTFLIRLSGPFLRGRVEVTDRVETILRRSATVVLAALVATSAVLVDGAWAGWALPAGVLVGGVLAWRKAPLALVVVAAAGTTALLRLAGVA